MNVLHYALLAIERQFLSALKDIDTLRHVRRLH